ncbi:hypothetical protein MPH_10341 [Macrophomina phaseolina MS6]|uniref:FAD-binding domain-containing protein n=1 Tax=Macrophomina phaseolina (strain MS6) TaxID=1126212 RepID=K2QRS0_MACPH|nr:hypothetical protein MPH_10341 [Macrophomina phaseolina MS6]
MTEVAIIGAGVAGTALALALDRHGIPCRIYEARAEGFDVLASGVSITPNGCRVLDALGVLPRIASRSYKVSAMTYKNARDETTDVSIVGSEARYGYATHRMYRKALFDELKAVLAERGVCTEYGARFERVVRESADEGVVFEVSGGRAVRAALLVGADGIWSSVRQYVAPGVLPEYVGTVCAYGHVPTASVRWPSEAYERYGTIQGRPGSLFFSPEVADGSDLMIGKQFVYPARDRAGWEALEADKEQLAAFYREGYEDWGPTAQSLIDQVCAHKDGILLWPYHRIPKMERWSSTMGRVMIVGDAAHAMPPSSGQGVNQALEDAYSLALLLSKTLPNMAPVSDRLNPALNLWRAWRQDRIDAVFAMTNATNLKRLPEEERQKQLANGKANDKVDPLKDEEWRKWMFQPDIEGEVDRWVQPRC